MFNKNLGKRFAYNCTSRLLPNFHICRSRFHCTTASDTLCRSRWANCLRPCHCLEPYMVDVHRPKHLGTHTVLTCFYCFPLMMHMIPFGTRLVFAVSECFNKCPIQLRLFPGRKCCFWCVFLLDSGLYTSFLKDCVVRFYCPCRIKIRVEIVYRPCE